MELKIDLGVFSGVFAVPNAVVDECLKISTGDNLKVILYCLRHSGERLSIGELSRATGIAPDNITSSFEFWKQRGVTGFGNINTNDNSMNDLANTAQTNSGSGETVITPDNTEAEEAEKLKKVKIAKLSRDYDYKPSDISSIINKSDETRFLFERCEELYGRPLKPSELKALAIIVEDIGMRVEVVLMLIDYCFSIGKTTTRYIKSVAADWVECGINSIELCDEKIKALKEYNSVEGEIIRLFKVKAIPDDKKAIIEKWLYEYNHPIETIYAAYQKALSSTGKLEYKYMDKVLTALYEGTSIITENGDIEFLSQRGNADKKNSNVSMVVEKTTSSFDLDELDRQIMEGYRKRISEETLNGI